MPQCPIAGDISAYNSLTSYQFVPIQFANVATALYSKCFTLEYNLIWPKVAVNIQRLSSVTYAVLAVYTLCLRKNAPTLKRYSSKLY